MSDDRGAGASGIILSFILGGLAGAALAVLFAPRSGEETRELLWRPVAKPIATRRKRCNDPGRGDGGERERGERWTPGRWSSWA